MKNQNPPLKPAFKVFLNDSVRNPRNEWMTILMPITSTDQEISENMAFYNKLGKYDVMPIQTKA